MRDVHLQTPQNDLSLANRKSKSIHDHSKKTLKNAKKNLNSEFSAFVEGAALHESPNDTADFSLISEAVDDYQFGDSTEKFVFPLLPEVSPSSDNGISSTYQCQNSEAKISVETEMAIKHLRQVRNQVMNSTDVDLQSKRLLDAVIDVVMQEFCGLPEKKKCSDSPILKKCLLVSLTFLLWILAVFFGSLFSSSGTQPFLGPLPT
ncbi:PREDICTED: uncharacterized protein LOC109169654 isoform X2 [Ipomoea nil]|uniref:uncharacterized protein LOC109169654 isoform X2 n=1 Tax=Ipomoea nil TaxID=35883 RepID=UPI0009019BB1|nr:PREDICTED: uncharacterized protein LOC109169654 isoform X2 [Ipomoea nil]